MRAPRLEVLGVRKTLRKAGAAIWRIIQGQMTHVASSVSIGAADASTKDLDRFRASLRRGVLGPHAHVSLLGLDAPDSGSVLRLVRKGLPYRAFERFQRNSNLSFERLIALINVPRRTMTRRKGEGRFLSDESDRLIRASRLYGKTLELFEGNRDAAVEWLTTAQPGLGGNVPVDLANTEVGAREVEHLVGRLEHGVFP